MTTGLSGARGGVLGVGLTVLALLVSGCSTTLGDVPLPGVGVSGDTITVEAEFGEALNLAEGATVKIDGVDAGRVQSIEVEDFHARAELAVRTDADLREGATARLRYNTPLGELFVDVENPLIGPPMTDGDTITLADSSTAPTVEDALSQASLLVNGGGLGDLQTVTEELNTVLGGREDVVRSLLERSRDFLVEANATTGDIDRALRALDSVSITLRDRQGIINRAVREITPAARVLRRNTPGLTRLLDQVSEFSATADDVVGRTREQILGVLRRAEPVLAELAKNRGVYPASLEQLISLGDNIDSVVAGDFASISLDQHLDGTTLPDLGDILEQLGIPLDLPPITLPELPAGLGDLTLGGLLNGGGR